MSVSIEDHAKGPMLRIEGAIADVLDDEVSRVLTSRDDPPVGIYLGINSGGATSQLEDAAERLRSAGIRRVYIGGACKSACALFAMQFQERVLLEGGALDFHGGVMAFAPTQRDPAANRRFRKTLLLSGNAREFVDCAIPDTDTGPGNPFWRPTVDVLVRYSVITGCADASTLTPIDCGQVRDLPQPKGYRSCPI